jgi:transposase InsO family protein
MTDANQLAQIYEELNFPNASVFHNALRRKGIPARLKDVEEFVKSRSERQILAAPPKYKGHIVADYENHRWAADLISFVSRPVKSAGELYTHILLVQDIFSRYLYARALTNVSQTTTAFKAILKESAKRNSGAAYKVPDELNTDGGTEFTSAASESMLERRNILHRVKQKEDLNAIATLDAAIQNIKRALARRVSSRNTDWFTELDAAIKGYNDSYHASIGTEPNDISDHDIFAIKKQNAIKLQETSDVIEKRKAELEKTGAFRVFLSKTGGLRQRADKARYSEKIHEVDSFPAAGLVKDTSGEEFLTKLVKPVPKDSSYIAPERQYEKRGSAKTDAIRRAALEPYVQQILPLVKSGGMTLGVLTKRTKTVAGFADELKKQNTNMKGFLQLFPEFQLHDGKVYVKDHVSSARQGPLDQFVRS